MRKRAALKQRMAIPQGGREAKRLKKDGYMAAISRIFDSKETFERLEVIFKNPESEYPSSGPHMILLENLKTYYETVKLIKDSASQIGERLNSEDIFLNASPDSVLDDDRFWQEVDAIFQQSGREACEKHYIELIKIKVQHLLGFPMMNATRYSSGPASAAVAAW